VLFLKYGRDDESQADGLGFRYALSDNYDVRHMVDMFKILQRVSGEAGSRIPEWQSSHPDPGNRIQATEDRLARNKVPLDGKKVGRAEFMRIIDGMVFGDNPRQGYFKEGVFYHPDMAFTLQFPSGWKTANQTSSVVGVSQAGDAQVQLSLAGKEAPSATLQKFLGQEGVTAGQTSSSSINGNTAAQGSFTAQNQDGSQLAGRVAFVSYNGTTYQLLGLATAAGARNNAGAISDFIGSFRRLTDQAALNVQPNRIAIVTVPRAMSLRQFNVQYPSSIELKQLALINGLDDEDSPLKQGDVVKRVVSK
jgi:predicted Zn-dependent protease